MTLKIAFLAIFVAFSIAVDVHIIDEKNSFESQYLVQFNENSTSDARGEHLRGLYKLFAADSFANVVLHKWNIGVFHAYSAKLSESSLEYVKRSSVVKIIEQDAKITTAASCSSQSSATWGIDRVASKTAEDLDGVYTYSTTAGAGTDSYVLDTGINIKHADFGGRAIWGVNYAGDGKNTDCNGHGTHVAGTMGSATYGIAKKTTLLAVKVLNCEGSGTYDGIISGVSWTVTSFQSRKRPSVANMSLGGGLSTVLNNAINAAVSSGVIFVVAAGNENADACGVSPASAASAITVGATGVDSTGSTQVDNRAYFSNYGKCTDIFAPGLTITSTWIGTKNTEIHTISGTSMASPHIAGVVALYLGDHTSSTPNQVRSWLVSSATNGNVRMDCTSALSKASCAESPNVFVHQPC